MRLARIHTPSGIVPAVADGDEWAVIVDAFSPVLERTGETVPLSEAQLAAPVEPRIVLGMLHNSGEADRALPPQAFAKSSRTVVGPGEPIWLEANKGRVVGETELALVVGRTIRNITVDEAPSAVLGWTIGNDVTATDQAAFDETKTQAKNGDGFTPLGPWIETDLDAFAQHMEGRLDGELASSGSTADLANNPFVVLAYLSQHMTLGPGDVVLTGAPNTAFELRAGAEASAVVDGIGVLSNPVRLLDADARP